MLLMKLDLHTHTYFSSDAIASPSDLIKAAKSKGLGGIAITDHNTTKSWKSITGAGKKEKIHVILGEEIKVFHEGSKIGEVIGLFLNEEIKPGEFLVVKDRIKEQGGIMVIAHPFDYFRNSFKKLEDFKKYADAVEAFNSRSVFNWFNKKAFEFAQKNNISMTAGTDAHCAYEIGNAYTIADIDEIEDLRKFIKKKKTAVCGKKANPLIHLVSTLSNLGIIGRNRPKSY